MTSDKKTREAAYSLLSQFLEVGGHFRIACLVTSRLPSSRSDARRILNACHVFAYFPRPSSSKIKYVLTEYIGLDEHQIAAFKKKNRRWASIIKTYPGIFVSERELGLLGPEEEEVEAPAEAPKV